MAMAMAIAICSVHHKQQTHLHRLARTCERMVMHLQCLLLLCCALPCHRQHSSQSAYLGDALGLCCGLPRHHKCGLGWLLSHLDPGFDSQCWRVSAAAKSLPFQAHSSLPYVPAEGRSLQPCLLSCCLWQQQLVRLQHLCVAQDWLPCNYWPPIPCCCCPLTFWWLVF